MDAHREDRCNHVVKLVLAGQDLLGLLHTGKDVEAHELASEIADAAAAIASELEPAAPGVA